MSSAEGGVFTPILTVSRPHVAMRCHQSMCLRGHVDCMLRAQVPRPPQPLRPPGIEPMDVDGRAGEGPITPQSLLQGTASMDHFTPMSSSRDLPLEAPTARAQRTSVPLISTPASIAQLAGPGFSQPQLPLLPHRMRCNFGDATLLACDQRRAFTVMSHV